MLKRTIVGAILAAILVFLMYFAPSWAMTAFISVLSLIAAFELLYNTKISNNKMLISMSMISAAVVPILVYFKIKYELMFVFFFVYVVIIFVMAMASKQTIKTAHIAVSIMAVTVFPLFMSSFIKIMAFDNYKYYMAIPFIAAFGSDVFAYFTGMLIGKHKLAPNLSPKKTVEGAIGGVLGALISMVLYGLFISTDNYLTLIVVSISGAIISMIGDLSMSYIKREWNIKDYGVIFPGHGGVLDRFDSVMFVTPLVYILLNILPSIKL